MLSLTPCDQPTSLNPKAVADFPKQPSLREESGALFNTAALVQVDAGTVEMLKARATAAAKRRFRLCLHNSTQDPVQEMVVVHCGGMYSRPHRHPGRCMSFQMIEGEQLVYLFDESGGVTDVIEMGGAGSGKTFCFRLQAGRWYMPVTQSEYVVFHETLAGPNRNGEGTEYARWSPVEEDHEGIRAFLDSMPKPDAAR